MLFFVCSKVSLRVSLSSSKLIAKDLLIVNLATSSPSAQERIVSWSNIGVLVLRILFTFITAYLLQISGLRLIGGILLLYICYKLYRDVIQNKIKERNIEVDNSNLKKAIFTVILADVTMSLDNVLGVAGAAGDHYTLLAFGLGLSILLMAFAANYTAKLIKKYSWISWVGLIAILFVAVQLIYEDLQILLWLNLQYSFY